MENKFINRKREQDFLDSLIKRKSRINILFSNEGIGKTALLENILNLTDSDCYIHITTDELLAQPTANYYFIKKIIIGINKKLGFKFPLQNKLPITVSLNMGPIGIGFELPLDYKKNVDVLIKNIKKFNQPIYIHIENIQKIDCVSLQYIIRIINETNNSFFFLECSDNADLCEKIKNILCDNMLQVEILTIDKLDWSHVSLILENLKIQTSSSIKKEYEKLNGNIKKLILDNKYNLKRNFLLNTEQLFILNFIFLINTNLSTDEIHKILQQYNFANAYLFSIPNIQIYINELLNMELIYKINYNHYYITDLGKDYIDKEQINIIVSILSHYYLPIIAQDGNEKIIGLYILINIYLKCEDSRIKKLIPYIEPNLIFLNSDQKILDNIFKFLSNNYTQDSDDSMLHIAKAYIKLNCFEEARNILDKYALTKSNLSIILRATALIHLEAEKEDTEQYIISQIEISNDEALCSALYTCLISLYMKTKPISFVLSCVENLKKENKLTKIDEYIIQKNISIYYNTKDAIKSLNKCKIYFEQNKFYRLEIATSITLATKIAQSGEIDESYNILETLCNNRYLGIHDFIYIENNLAVLNILKNEITERVIDKLKEAYCFCNDLYTKLLITNNILIFYVKSKKLDKATKYANILEQNGFDIFIFDDYLHLTYLNLKYYYTQINNSDKVNYYNEKLRNLKHICYSNDLKEYISASLNEINTLSLNNTWSFMASYNYRPAFIGHWIVNNFDC